MIQNKEKYILDSHKLLFHMDRVKDLLDGKRVAPITIDWALTQRCPYNCVYCFSHAHQTNTGGINRKSALHFLDDCAELGVKSTSLVSDGESTIVPFFYETVKHGKDLGIDMALGTCGFPLKKEKLRELLPSLTYLRFNISAGEPKRYAEIHGVPEKYYHKVIDIIKSCVEIKKENGMAVTIGLQMVLMPEFADQILPLTKLGKELGVDYTVIKHCSDDETGSIGVNYDKYKALYPLIEKAESYTTNKYLVKAKWSKIKAGRERGYGQCFAPPIMLQISGTGIMAPCGSFFSEKYKKYHIGNINKERFRDLIKTDRYWEVMRLISTEPFDTRKDCACLCLQDKANEFLWGLKKGLISLEDCKPDYQNIPPHVNFV